MEYNEKDSNEERKQNWQNDAKCKMDIAETLWNMGYDISSEQEMIDILRAEKINMQSMMLPYNSKNLDEWQRTLNKRHEFFEKSQKEMEACDQNTYWT